MQFVLNSNNYLSRKQKGQIHQYRLQLRVCTVYSGSFFNELISVKCDLSFVKTI